MSNIEASDRFRSWKQSLVADLIPGLCHELNNPVNNLFLTLETLIEEDETLKPEERLEMIREALDEADRLRAWVRDLEELTRDHPPDEVSFSLEPLVDQCLRWIKHESKVRRLRMVKKVQGPLGDCLTDRSNLRLAVLHLLRVGFRSFEKGKQVTITLERKGEEVGIELKGPEGRFAGEKGEPPSRRTDLPVLLDWEILEGLLRNLGGRLEVGEDIPGVTKMLLSFPRVRAKQAG